MKRTYLFLMGLVALSSAVYITGQIRAQAPQPMGGTPPAAQPATRTDKPRIAVFNVAKVMKDFEKWQYYANQMNLKRNQVAGQLGKLRTELQDLAQRAEKEPRKDEQEKLTKAMTDKQRQFEDLEKTYRKQLDDESALHLKNLFSDIDRAVKAIVAANEYDIVFAYPDAVNAEEANSPLYYDIKMRPPAAMPFYVSKTVDMTPILVKTLNDAFKPPVIPAGGSTPVPGPAPVPGPMPMR